MPRSGKLGERLGQHDPQELLERISAFAPAMRAGNWRRSMSSDASFVRAPESIERFLWEAEQADPNGSGSRSNWNR